jgi:archaellum biogenesis ATPase FlaH
MIHSIDITDPEKTAFRYLKKVRYFKSHPHIELPKGITLVIGENGCGKSTLLNLIRYPFLEQHSRVPYTGQFWLINQFFKKDSYEGIDVKANYDIGTFSFDGDTDKKKQDSVEDFLNTINSSSMSKGEQQRYLYHDFITRTYANLNGIEDKSIEKYNSPKAVFEEISQRDTDPRYLDTFHWYERNQVDDNIPTILMDEPEKYLSVRNTIALFNGIKESFDDIQEKMQYIIVCHNPVLIQRLSAMDVNIIEMTRGFLKYFQY